MMTALVAAFAGMFGIAIGRFWDTRAESARWRRDQRATSYLRIAEAYWEILRELDAIAGTQNTQGLGEPRNWALLSPNGMAALDRWNSALMSVLVYGSPRVAGAAKNVDDCVDECGMKASSAQHDWESWATETSPLKKSFQDLLAAIRGDLKLQSHSLSF
ncbi:hypothetical protein [Nocardia sp. XZ_19_369]|uniref:hypothetical protein n=1 Tax=Nocardia sp. XZ_19_369 TaxID=2769487 RepID=UPI00188F7812|nr:hypothetical protein [Nocardia sp. XZ_19_369]